MNREFEKLLKNVGQGNIEELITVLVYQSSKLRKIEHILENKFDVDLRLTNDEIGDTLEELNDLLAKVKVELEKMNVRPCGKRKHSKKKSKFVKPLKTFYCKTCGCKVEVCSDEDCRAVYCSKRCAEKDRRHRYSPTKKRRARAQINLIRCELM